MEAVRRYVEAEELMTILSLPEQYRNYDLEVIVIPTNLKTKKIKKEKKGEILESLVGSIPFTNLSLEELRNERIKKYENIDWYKYIIRFYHR